MEPLNAAPPPVFLPPGTVIPPPIPVLPLDENGNVNADVPCRGCSYNVRGLHENGKCPECGTPIGLSIRGNLLRYSDPAWVDKLLRGIDLILWGLLAATLAGFAGGIVGTLMGRQGTLVSRLIGIAAAAVGFIGAWFLTTPDPGTEEQSQVVTARKIVRFALLFGMAENFLSMLSESEHLNPFLSALLGASLVVAAIVGVIGEVARLYYLEKLALRIPDAAIAKRAKTVRWGYGISLALTGVLGAVIAIVMMILKQPPRGAWFGVYTGAACIAGIGALVLLGFMIVYIVMLFQFRKALKVQREMARQIWELATTSPPPVQGSV